MRQSDLIYTINEDYHIEIRVRKCYNTFRLRLLYRNERIDEICCPEKEYNRAMNKLINRIQ